MPVFNFRRLKSALFEFFFDPIQLPTRVLGSESWICGDIKASIRARLKHRSVRRGQDH
jgi:hypothetical protein